MVLNGQRSVPVSLLVSMIKVQVKPFYDITFDGGDTKTYVTEAEFEKNGTPPSGNGIQSTTTTPQHKHDSCGGGYTLMSAAAVASQKKTPTVAPSAPPAIKLEEASPLVPWFQKYAIRTNAQLLQVLSDLGVNDVNESKDFEHLDEEDIENICSMLTTIGAKKFRGSLGGEQRKIRRTMFTCKTRTFCHSTRTFMHSS